MSVRVTVTGRLTSDPQQRQAQNGNSYTTLSVAGNEHNRDEDESFFFGAMFFGKRGETVAGYHKGDLVSMTGHLHEYQGNDGKTYKQLNYAEIELLQRKQPVLGQNLQPSMNDQQPINNQGNLRNNFNANDQQHSQPNLDGLPFN